MPVTPSVLIIEKSRFPGSVPLEECERLGKTTNNEAAIIRFQRPSKVNLLEAVGRFFSDLFHGVTRARGTLCEQPGRMPAIIHIRGQRCLVDKAPVTGPVALYARRDVSADGVSPPVVRFSALRIEIRDTTAAPVWRDDALADKMAEQLRDRIEAHGMAADLFAVETFLKLDARPELALTPRRVLHLIRFSDVLTKLAGPLRDELSDEVRLHVLDTLQHLQAAIGKLKTSDKEGAPLAYPTITFSALSAFGAPAPAVAAAATGQPAPAAIPAPPASPAPPAPLAPLAAPAPSIQIAQTAASTEPPPPPAAPVPPPPAPPAPTPPGTPPSIKRPSPAAAPSQPDAESLAAARNRLKPASPDTRPRDAASTTEAHSLGSILAKAMGQRRDSLASEPKQKGGDRSDDEWE